MKQQPSTADSGVGPEDANECASEAYPQELLCISESNAKARKRFAQALDAFNADENFDLASRYMAGYNTLVLYDEFFTHDARPKHNPQLSIVVVAYHTNQDHCITAFIA